MIGSVISHYKILEKLGEGGMGIVYKAHDTKLDRTVALKFLPPQLEINDSNKVRFIQEAKAAAALNHPNVCVIHDIEEYEEQSFIVMEYVDGQTLRKKIETGKLNIEETVNIAIQIVGALHEAHTKGIVHRDIKSDNIMITLSGQVKVMDFGLAKLKGSLKVTKSSSTVGTLAYMAPEQIEGDEIDARSDIFSLGIVLYEMLTGQLPFKGDYEAAVMYAILNEEPEPIEKHLPDISSELLHILNRSLEKDPNNRYQSMNDMLIDFQRLKRDTSRIPGRSNGIHQKKKIIKARSKYVIPVIVLFIIVLAVTGYRVFFIESEEEYKRIPIAVIDFVNETNEPELNGLSGMLITALEQSQRLSVLTRSRMFDILKKLKISDIEKIDESLGRKICREAQVNTLAAASIRKFGELYTIDFKVLNVEENEYIFTSKEQGEGQESIPAMIDNLSDNIRQGLEEKVTDIKEKAKTIAEITSPNLEAYQHYFKGQEFIDKLKFDLAVAEFNKAIKLDPTFALAYYRLAYAIDWEANPKHAFGYISKAISMLEHIPEKERYLVRAQLARLENGMDAGIVVLEEMEQIYPDEKEMLYNIGDWSWHIGDFVKAKQYLEKVLRMDPVFIRALQHITWTYRDLGMFEKMFDAAKQYNSVSDSKESFDLLSDAYIELGKYEEGLQLIERTQELHPERHYLASLTAKFYIFQERYGEAEKELMKLIAGEKPGRVRLLGHIILANFYNYVGKYRDSMNACDYVADYFWQKNDTSLTAYWQLLKGYRLFEGWKDFKAGQTEIEKTFAYQNSIDYMLYWTGLTYYYIIIRKFNVAKKLAKSININWWYFSVISLIHIQEKECKQAEAVLDTVIHSCPSATRILLLYHLAKCQFEQQEYEKSIQTINKMQSIRNIAYGFRALYYTKSYYLLAKNYEQMGDHKKALINYVKFLDMWKNADQDLPELIDAKKRFKNLKQSETSI
jgi:serine/threonine protein kinase/tetratricopeptide (TPR) repeat protein